MASVLQTREALRLVEGDRESKLLTVARELSDLLRAAKLDAGVVGGVAVVLHGHVRTTVDVDLFTAADRLETVRTVLVQAGYEWNAQRREFSRGGIPVQLVTEQQTGAAPRAYDEREGVRIVSLPDLVNMKLRSGLSSPARAQDLADVVGLIRVRGLSAEFAARLDRSVRREFRRLVRAVAKERP